MSNIPSTYMKTFCSSIDHKWHWGSVCVKWFKDATEHCARLISHSKSHGPYLWRIMVGFIFPEQPSALMSMEHPVPIHPSRLTLRECGYLYQDIVHDYEFVYSLMVFMFMGMLFGAIKLYEKYAYVKKLAPHIVDPQMCKQKAASRSLRMAKEEVSRLKVLS